MKDYAKIVSQPQRGTAHKAPSKQGLASTAIQKNKEATASSGSNLWLYVGVALIIGIVVFSGYRQHLQHAGMKGLQKLRDEEKAANLAAQKSVVPQFDFYKDLPNGNSPSASTAGGTNLPAPTGVVPPPATTVPAAPGAMPATALGAPVTAPVSGANPVSVTTPPATPANPAASSTATTSTHSYLNAGSFANSADAQQMLSQLLLLGMSANIQSTQDNGEPSYQVLVGPFDDQDALGVAKQQLLAHQIPVTVVQK